MCSNYVNKSIENRNNARKDNASENCTDVSNIKRYVT
jgi:hypothetical protein